MVRSVGHSVPFRLGCQGCLCFGFGTYLNRRSRLNGDTLDAVKHGSYQTAMLLEASARVLWIQQLSWTAEDDSARSVVEVVAQELGPSLRWATARRSGPPGAPATRPVRGPG
jgi:hypothetical protein